MRLNGVQQYHHLVLTQICCWLDWCIFFSLSSFKYDNHEANRIGIVWVFEVDTSGLSRTIPNEIIHLCMHPFGYLSHRQQPTPTIQVKKKKKKEKCVISPEPYSDKICHSLVHNLQCMSMNNIFLEICQFRAWNYNNNTNTINERQKKRCKISYRSFESFGLM